MSCFFLGPLTFNLLLILSSLSSLSLSLLLLISWKKKKKKKTLQKWPTVQSTKKEIELREKNNTTKRQHIARWMMDSGKHRQWKHSISSSIFFFSFNIFFFYKQNCHISTDVKKNCTRIKLTKHLAITDKARKRKYVHVQSFLDSTYKKRRSRLKAYSNPVFSFLNST